MTISHNFNNLCNYDWPLERYRLVQALLRPVVYHGPIFVHEGINNRPERQSHRSSHDLYSFISLDGPSKSPRRRYCTTGKSPRPDRLLRARFDIYLCQKKYLLAGIYGDLFCFMCLIYKNPGVINYPRQAQCNLCEEVRDFGSWFNGDLRFQSNSDEEW